MARVQMRFNTRRQARRGGIRGVQRSVATNTNRAAYNFAQRVEGGAKRRVHVISGRLRRSIVRVTLAPGKHRVIVGEYYGIYEEFGTRHRPPHPFFRPAVAAARVQFMNDMRKVFKP